MTTNAMKLCAFSHTPVDGRHLTGDATLRGHCPGCGRQYVPADPIPGRDLWRLREHTPLHTGWHTPESDGVGF